MTIFRGLKIKTGISRLRPHLLRHTFATRYLQNGGDAYSLQSILGHTTLEMTKRYVQTTPWKTAVTFTSFSSVDNMMKKSRPTFFGRREFFTLHKEPPAMLVDKELGAMDKTKAPRYSKVKVCQPNKNIEDVFA